MLLVTGSFTLVYVVGTAAAVRLLPRGIVGVRRRDHLAGRVIALLVVTGAH